MSRVVLGTVDEFPPGTSRGVEVGGKTIAVFHEGGRFYALRDVCPHMGARLSAGVVWSALKSTGPGQYQLCAERKFVRCPWHGWEYELATGQSWYDPVKDHVKAYEISVERGSELAPTRDGLGWAEGPYTAETYRIAVEDRYVVIEL
jgi:nitrite reductase/ring-hydroxylating ferredoxin subunit